jgi:hypothetical protein
MCTTCSFAIKLVSLVISLPHLLLFATLLIVIFVFKRVLSNLNSVIHSFEKSFFQILFILNSLVEKHIALISTVTAIQNGHVYFKRKSLGLYYWLMDWLMPISSIYRNFPMCIETNNSIDLDLSCKDHACLIYKKIVYQMSTQDDMFNYIYTGDFKQIIVYSNKGRVYHTEYETISSFDLIQPHDCSKYVAVSNMKFQTSKFKL